MQITCDSGVVTRWEVRDPKGGKHKVLKDDKSFYHGAEGCANWHPNPGSRPYIVAHLLNYIAENPDMGETPDGYTWVRL